ncbi:MAG: hypothetical protein ACYST6_18170 [Planctomycetota bacterium]|jgi:hypothetical protein
MRKKKTSGNRIAVKGFFRVQVLDKKTRKIVGDSGWTENQITNYGLNSCVVAAPIGAASVQAAGLLLGSGAANPASDAVTLASSLSKYYSAFAQSSVIDSLTARMTQSFDGTLDAVTLNNIGVFAASSGSLIAGKTFASSALTTDQDVNCTYELRYSTS